MKELSIEEKAKRYDEAIEVIRKCETDKYGCVIGMKPSDILSELKESEDERIKRILKKVLWDCNEGNTPMIGDKEVADCIAWLEKQGEQKPTDEEMKILLQTEYEKGRADAIEQKSAWSEEDNYNIERLFCILNNEQDNYPQLSCDFQEIKDIKNWLKSIKERYTWKPSEEQMKLLGMVAELNKDCLIGKELMTLYNDLKKLKKE